MKPSNNLEKKAPSDTYSRVQLVCKEVQAHSSLEPPLEYNRRLIMTFLTVLKVTEILCIFRLVLEGKTYKEISGSSRLEFLEKLSANNFALSEAEDNTDGPLNRGSITNLILLTSLLAICQKSQEPCF